MFQYTTTNVINSQYALDYEGNRLVNSSGSDIYKYVGTTAGLNVNKVGNFKIANIVSIHKRPYTVGIKEIAKVQIPQIASGLTARLEVILKLSQSAQSEYVNYSLDFLKPIVVEIVATNNAANDAASLVTQLNALKDRFGVKYFKAEVITTDYIQITCTWSEQRVKSMIISKSAASYNSTIQPEYTDVSSTTFSVTTNGKNGFGDDDWIARRIMLQTFENTRFFGITKDERLVSGGNYSEYALRYSVSKDGVDGISSGTTSVTTHIFYVKSDLVPSFEAAIYTTTKPIISLSSDQIFTLGLTYDNSPTVTVNITGIVPFIASSTEITAVSGTLATATIGTITVNAPTGTPATQTATIALTKVAAGTTIVSVTIDGVTKTVTATVADFELDFENDEYLDTAANETDTITYSGNAGAVTFATTDTTKVAVGASTGIVTTAGKTATGSATITATDAAGNTATLEYTVVELVLAYTVDGTLDTSDNESDQIVVTGDVGSLTFESDQPTRATVNGTGLVTTDGVTGEGDAIITVTDTTTGAVKTITYTVVA